MQYRLNFEVYRRPFRTPLKTHHGLWSVREGLIVSLTDALGNTTRGEIAPLPWFGTETLAEAIAFCSDISGHLSSRKIQQIPNHLPACQFGFETATWPVNPELLSSILNPEKCCQLLTPQVEMQSQVLTFIKQGFRTFKLKIAVHNFTDELECCEQILAILPPDGKLRLDANGGLSLELAKRWGEWGDRQPQLEFLEQPLSPENFTQLLWLQNNFQTTIALDESVTNLENLVACYEQGWRGVFVIKAAIAGFPHRLKELCNTLDLDVVFSTVFETVVGRNALLHLASEVRHDRAFGMGGSHWFND
ncbi:o-succinylbenzoate synthase [[Limnothrix rosea] IAM M-220]|nr:o-succinylbenzoate synthase [[Limnothrix rosea] IAM M-220]